MCYLNRRTNGFAHANSIQHHDKKPKDDDEDDWKHTSTGVHAIHTMEKNFNFPAGAFLLILIPMFMLSYLFMSAAYSAVFKAIRSQTKFRWCDFCAAMGTDVCHTLWMCLTMTVLTMVAVVVPIAGIWLSFATSLVVPLHRDNVKLGMCKAICSSIKITHRYFCNILGYFLLCAVIIFVSMWVPFALLVAIPVVKISHVFLYHHLIGINGAQLLVPRNALSLQPDQLAANPLLHAAQEAN